MSDLIFYTNLMSRGQIARWMLEEAGADYQQVIVEFGADMKSTDYLAINPMGKVPAIKHGDKVVTESAAICAYLADAFPDTNLAPALDKRADYYRWLFFAAGSLESAIVNNVLGFVVPEDKHATVGYGSYDLTINTLDQMLGDRDYVCGDYFTAADVYVGCQVDWGISHKTMPETENFTAYVDRLRARAAYQKAKQIDAELMPKAT